MDRVILGRTGCGKRPNSVRFRKPGGEEGEWSPWYSHRAIEPLAPHPGAWADWDLHRSRLSPLENGIITDNLAIDFMVRAMGNQLKSSWFEPVNDFVTAFSEYFDYDATQDPGGQGTSLKRLLNKQMVSGLPWGSAARAAARRIDPVFRRTNEEGSLFDEALKIVPWATAALEPTLNVYTGQPKVWGGTLGQSITDREVNGGISAALGLEMFNPVSAYEYPQDPTMKELYQVQITGGALREPGYNTFTRIGQYGRDPKARMNTKERNHYIRLRTFMPLARGYALGGRGDGASLVPVLC